MENVADALLMGFAVLIFVIALSVSFSTLAQAKSTADVVLFYSDRDNFQTPLIDHNSVVKNGGRIVGIDTVISTIYRCSKENFVVSIQDDGKDYLFEYTVKKKEQIDNEIKEFIVSQGNDFTNKKFKEEYVEVTISGTTYEGTLEENVGKKLYIYYTKI